MSDTELRELDAFIAEHVMEATWCGPNLLLAGELIFKKDRNALITIGYPNGRFTPTTDPAAAMEVLERCVSESPQHKIEILKAGDEWLLQYKDGCVYETAQDATLPLAICEIARKLFGEVE